MCYVPLPRYDLGLDSYLMAHAYLARLSMDYGGVQNESRPFMGLARLGSRDGPSAGREARESEVGS